MWNKCYPIQVAALLLCLACTFGACSSDDDPAIEQPTAQGVFIDPRDGTSYHYVHLGGLDWSVENLSYDLGDRNVSRIYQTVDDHARQVESTALRSKYGMLYTYSAAQQAVPEGWRLPTDQDWAALETTRGYLCSDFSLLYGGYYTKNTYASAANGNRFMGSWAYFWTSTPDTTKEGQYCFARKKFYATSTLQRLSIEPEAYFLSVRFVR